MTLSPYLTLVLPPLPRINTNTSHGIDATVIYSERSPSLTSPSLLLLLHPSISLLFTLPLIFWSNHLPNLTNNPGLPRSPSHQYPRRIITNITTPQVLVMTILTTHQVSSLTSLTTAQPHSYPRITTPKPHHLLDSLLTTSHRFSASPHLTVISPHIQTVSFFTPLT